MAVIYLTLDPSAGHGREFLRMAGEQAEGKPIQVHLFSSGQQATAYCEQYDRIERLVILAHGDPIGIGWFSRNSGGGIRIGERPGFWTEVRRFARSVAPRLAPNSIVGLAACSCGMERQYKPRMQELHRLVEHGRASPDEEREFRRLGYHTSTGVNSFAGKLRDALLSAGAQGVEVRAHLWKGHTIRNPHIITMRAPAQSPGFIMSHSIGDGPPSPGSREFGRWSLNYERTWFGPLAISYILGGDLPDNISMSSHPVTIPGFTPGPASDSGVIPSRSSSPLGGERSFTSGGRIPTGQRWNDELPREEVVRRETTEWAAGVERQLGEM